MKRGTSPRFAAGLPIPFLLSTLVLAACGSGGGASHGGGASDGGADGSAGADPRTETSIAYPAPHPTFPTLVTQGGRTLSAPKVFLVFYEGYPYEAQVTQFARALGGSDYWAATTREYGVGAVQLAGSIELPGPAPTTITGPEIAQFMHDELASGAFGTPDPDVVYSIFYPPTTTITKPGDGQSCAAFTAYHSDLPVVLGEVAEAGAPADGSAPGTTQSFAYAVMPTCVPAVLAATSQLDQLTAALSHEWVEAATDPFPTTNGGANAAYAQTDDDHAVWSFLGGEAGDLCELESNALSTPADLGFSVQRIWSNQLAAAGHDPCSPRASAAPFFDGAPVADETVHVWGIQTKGVTIPIGQKKTIEIDLFSDAPTSGPWTVDAVDLLSRLTGTAPTLSFAWDKQTGVNGDKVHLTVTVTSGAAEGTEGVHVLGVTSRLGGIEEVWPVLVVE